MTTPGYDSAATLVIVTVVETYGFVIFTTAIAAIWGRRDLRRKLPRWASICVPPARANESLASRILGSVVYVVLTIAAPIVIGGTFFDALRVGDSIAVAMTLASLVVMAVWVAYASFPLRTSTDRMR